MELKNPIVLLLLIPAVLLVVFAEAAEPPTLASLAPSLTEIVYSMGLENHLAARSSACDYPPEASSLPVVGAFGRPNWEVLRRIEPDVVAATSLEKPGLLNRMSAAGMKALLLPCESWQELMSAAVALGEALGDPAAGESWVAEMEARREKLGLRVEERWHGRSRPRVYVEVWGDPLTTAGGKTFLNDMINLAGGENIAAELSSQYPHVSSEWVIRQNPDVILICYMLPNSSSAQTISERLGWGSITAIRDNSFCSRIPPDHLLRPGPRLLDGAEALAVWLDGWDRMEEE